VSIITTECIPHFARTRHGYDPVAVDQFIAMLTQTQQSLLNDVQILHTRLSESAREVAALKAEVATLYDTSPSADAMTYRISKLLQTAVDEVSQMQTEAQTQAAARVAAANSEAEKLLSDAEIIADTLTTDARTNAEKLLGKATADAEKLLSTAKINATRQIQQAQSKTEELAEQQISILEQLMAVYRTLDGVPAFLASAYHHRNSPATPPAHPASAPAATNIRCGHAHTRPTGSTDDSWPCHRPGDQPVHHQASPR
jgi:cell division septum initiation protein DivIVA